MDLILRSVARDFDLSQAKEILGVILNNPGNANRDANIKALETIMKNNGFILGDLIDSPLIYVPFEIRRLLKPPDEAVS